MRRKRLKHCADTLCHMFCGWRLVNSYTDIEMLGSGTLEIDVLTGDSTFNGQSTGPLVIADELRLWLIEDCESNDIPIDQLRTAKLMATLDLTKVEWKQRRSIDHRCVIECNSLIGTDESEYSSRYNDTEEWS